MSIGREPDRETTLLELSPQTRNKPTIYGVITVELPNTYYILTVITAYPGLSLTSIPATDPRRNPTIWDDTRQPTAWQGGWKTK